MAHLTGILRVISLNLDLCWTILFTFFDDSYGGVNLHSRLGSTVAPFRQITSGGLARPLFALPPEHPDADAGRLRRSSSPLTGYRISPGIAIRVPS